MRDPTLRRSLPRWGAAYVVAGLLAAAAPGFEVFPVFCWFLFPVVPGPEPRFELVVSQLGGEPVDPPTDVQRLGLVRDPKAMDLWLATQRLGAAVERGDERDRAKARRLIETGFLCQGARYRLDRVQFDPLERWQTGHVRERTPLVAFDSEAACARSPWAIR